MTVQNVVVRQSAWQESDIELLFEDEEVHFTDVDDLSVLMKEMGIFESSSAARRAGRVGPIPEGFTFNFKASKKCRLWIWNPTE